MKKSSNFIQVKKENLPLRCPQENFSIREMHPVVYLPIKNNAFQQCPYCGNKYFLKY